MISVAIADDQALVRSGFRLILEARPDLEVVGEADDGLGAIELVRALDPDVILVDIRMPNLDGIEATKQIIGSGLRTRVLILTTFDLDDYVYEAIRAGASGFLLKDVQPEELVDAIRVVAAGNALLAPATLARLLERFGSLSDENSAFDTSRLEALTEREDEVLRLVAEGLSNAEIAALLYLSETTVKTHVSNLLRKIGARDRVHAVIAAYDSGIVRPRHTRQPGPVEPDEGSATRV